MSQRFGLRSCALACTALLFSIGLAAQESGPADPRRTPESSLHRAFSVPGGAALEPLKCRPSAKPAPQVARPAEGGPAPAGSQEEELPLTQEQERELLTQAPPPPSRDELRQNLPHEDWIKQLHQQLRQASGSGLARIGIWGGSHMAAEFFVSELRRPMQTRYGAGGAGHINLLYGSLGIRLPAKALCRQGRWQHELAPRPADSTPQAVGLGLFALSSREAGAAIEFDPTGSQGAVRTVTVHYLRQEGAGVLDVLVDGELVESIDTSGASAVGSIRINAAQAIGRIKLVASDERGVTLLGAFAEDTQGLVLDNFGIAGASGNFWTNARADLLGQALGQRPYHLVVLAYGTNDVTGAQWDPAQYRARFEATLESMRRVQAALSTVEASLVWGERWAVVFSGLSLGSILLLVALGLAITYGLMGVINMAHGELMMIGAYATFVVQGVFQRFFPTAFDLYLLAAVPVAFCAAAAMGALLERGVIRFLYGRPLETLLATWGISLMLQQGVRSVFGAQNVSVENPSWMSGGVQVMSNLQLPWNRLIIVAFALGVLLAVALLISQTRLGLFVRGVTQNRSMAACMGVNTARTDTYAFALGSGIAGLAGCALSQIGNVGPDLGQAYIVDAFMVVVVGGVGQLAGTVYAALGLGVLNKFLEGWTGAVLAKIAVLVLIIVFIQKRPQGIFAMRGRSAEA